MRSLVLLSLGFRSSIRLYEVTCASILGCDAENASRNCQKQIRHLQLPKLRVSGERRLGAKGELRLSEKTRKIHLTPDSALNVSSKQLTQT